jgi:phenylacetate-CoA ligase
MKARSLLSSKVLIPIAKTCSGRHVLACREHQRFLEGSQFWDEGRLRAYQDERLRRLIRHAHANCPRYREVMEARGLTPEDIRTRDDLPKLPLLTRQELIEGLDRLRARNCPERALMPYRTGGSSGMPALFYRDRRSEYAIDASNRRFGGFAGFSPGMSVALLWGNMAELNKAGRLRYRLRYLMFNQILLNSFHLTEHDLEAYARRMQRLRPEVVRGYASAVSLFVRELERRGIGLPSPRCVILTSEHASPQEKEQIGRFFGCAVFEEYGCREFSMLAYECPAHAGLHVAAEHYIIEVVDPQTGEPAPEGRGEVVVTSLINYAMPFVRYALGDASRLLAGRCACGRGLPRLDFVEGRVADCIITRSGVSVGCGLFETLFEGLSGITQYQVRQERPGHITLRLVAGRGHTGQEAQHLLERLSVMFPNDLTAVVEYCEAIETTPSGKRRRVVSEVGGSFPDRAAGAGAL